MKKTLVIGVFLLPLWLCCEAQLFAGPFLRGDANQSGDLDTSDAIQTLSYLFLGGRLGSCADAVDTDDSGQLELTDAISSLNYLFLGIGKIPAPGPNSCGEDPTPDVLGCEAFEPCGSPPEEDTPGEDHSADAEPPDRDPDASTDGTDEPEAPEETAPPCETFYAGPSPPLEGPSNCTGSRPRGTLETEPTTTTAPPGADQIPRPPPRRGRTSVAWHGGAGAAVYGPTAVQTAGSFGAPVEVLQLAANLYDASGSDLTAPEFVETLQAGSVEIGHLGWVWGEVDRVCRGVTSDLDLVLGRRYFSRSAFRGEGSVGAGWFHSLYERLVFIDSERIRHVSWEQPYNDPDLYYIRSKHGTFRPANGLATSLVALDVQSSATVAWPGASYALRAKGRTHYFDSSGRIVTRVGASGLDGIEFRYDPASGSLEEVTDSRGQVIAVETSGPFITKLRCGAGNGDGPEGVYEIDYEIEAGQLIGVVLPSREVATVTERSPGGELEYTTETRRTRRSFSYDADSEHLNAVHNDAGETVVSVTYAAPSTSGREGGRVERVADPNGEWRFGMRSEQELRITDPRGFHTDYTLNAALEPVELRQVTAGTEAASNRPEDTVPDFYRWQFRRDESCQCGRLEEVREPDGGKYVFGYDQDGNMTRMEKHANTGHSGVLVWTWRYDSEGRAIEYVPPEGNAAAEPHPYAFTLGVGPDPATDNRGGRVYTLYSPTREKDAAAATWVWREDERRRILEYIGPSHSDVANASDSGDYHRYEYYSDVSVDGANAHLTARYRARRGGPWTEYRYDAAGRLTQTTTHHGAAAYTFMQDWDAEQRLRRWSAPRRGDQQYVLEYLYDGEGRRAVTRYTYFQKPRGATGQATPRWIERVLQYNAADQVTRYQWDVEPGRSARALYEYDAAGNLNQVTDPDGKVSRAVYDERGLPWKTFDAYGTDKQAAREYFYTADGRIAGHREPFDGTPAVLKRTYDLFDRLASIESPGKLAIEDTFDAGGRVRTRVTKALEDITVGQEGGSAIELQRCEFEYDDWHEGYTRKTVTVRTEDGARVLRTITSTTDYAPSSRPVRLSLNGEPYATFEYTSSGLPAVIADRAGNREILEYHPVTEYLIRHAHEQWDPVDETTKVYERTFRNDPAGRPVEVSYNAPGESSNVYQYGYDSLDHVVRHVDPLGVVTRQSYGYDGRLLERRRDVDPSRDSPTAQSVESFTYTTGGRVETLTDNRGKSVSFFFDERGRKYREVNADGSYWQWEYNDGNFVVLVTTPERKRFEIRYNDWGLPASRTVTSGGGALLRTSLFTWNPLGQLRSASTSEGGHTSTVSLERDSLGRILREIQDGRAVAYERDALGRLERLVGPSGYARHYTYDDHHRVREIRQESADGPRVAALTYQGVGRALRELHLGPAGRGAGLLRVERDGFGRVARLRTNYAEANVLDYKYDYDDMGRVRYEKRAHEDGRGDVFSYDTLNRLEHFIRSSSAPEVHTDDLEAELPYVLRRYYDLDSDHHRRAVVTTRFGTAAETESYLTHPERHHYTNVGGVVRTQNLDGNLTKHGQRTLTYDATDKLIEVEDAGETVATYTYDPFGRRSSKTVSSDAAESEIGGAVTTHYVYAGPWLIEEYRGVGGVSELEAVHFHATGVDEVVMSKRRDRRDLDTDGDQSELLDLYLHRNRLGSVTALTLSSGVVVEQYAYDAYGTPDIVGASGDPVPAPPSGNSFLFTARQYDPETGYYDFRARTYDPSTGTFLQEDPLGLVDGLNPVAYVLANPSLFVDPLGTLALENLVEGMMDFLRENQEIIRDAAGLLVLIKPLEDLLDLIAAATGYNLSEWIAGGFRGEIEELTWWERVTVGVAAATIVAGGVIAIAAVIGRLDKIYDKIKSIVRRVKSGCFAAGALVLLASGEAAPIEQIGVGDIVSCQAGLHQSGLESDVESGLPDHFLQVDPETWQVVTLKVREDSGSTADVTLLRPVAWLKRSGAALGDSIRIEIAESHLYGDGTIREIRPCPEVGEQGPGQRVVTATFRRHASELHALYLEGQAAPVRATGGHLFFSTTRGSWLELRELRRGEVLATRDGPVRVERIVTRTEGATVYNLEVHRSHTYFVGERSVLVHNMCAPKNGPALPGDYWKKRKTPTQMEPGARRITDQKPSSRGRGDVYERTTHYDEYGRQTGQTHRTSHGEPNVHPDPHHHTRDPVTGQRSGPQPGVHPDY